MHPQYDLKGVRHRGFGWTHPLGPWSSSSVERGVAGRGPESSEDKVGAPPAPVLR